jgi:hypothetical protein
MPSSQGPGRLVVQAMAYPRDIVAARVSQHLHGGADHVMLQVLSQGGQPGPIEVARSLAGRLPGAGQP